MATLTKTRAEDDRSSSIYDLSLDQDEPTNLSAGVPTPFPTHEERARLLLPEHLFDDPSPSLNLNLNLSLNEDEAGTEEGGRSSAAELIPSISHVSRSCLMTLNTLLCPPSTPTTPWAPIVPDRRHSMPNPPSSSQPQPQIDSPLSSSSSSALHTLVVNLRNRANPAETETGTFESGGEDDDTASLLTELRTRVSELSPSLPETDAHLAHALTTLLTYFHHLSTLSLSLPSASTHRGPNDLQHNSHSHSHSPSPLPMLTLLSSLRLQLSSLQSGAPTLPPVQAVELALLWGRIDRELESVQRLCRLRATESLSILNHPPSSSSDHLPPSYSHSDADDAPPQYSRGSFHSNRSKADLNTKSYDPTSSTNTLVSTTEKMRMDLEAITMAIDRLYLVAPQLHNQRVELGRDKVAEMERARLAGAGSGVDSSSSSGSGVRIRQRGTKGKQKEEKERDLQELEKMLELLSKASERKIPNQSVVLNGGMEGRLEKARKRDEEKREAFVTHLASHSSARRIHAQDASLPLAPKSKEKEKDPEALLSLPEFIREAPPAHLQKHKTDLLTLPEFIRESASDGGLGLGLGLGLGGGGGERRPVLQRFKSQQRLSLGLGMGTRSRSLSSPALAWFRPNNSKTAGASGGGGGGEAGKTNNKRSKAGSGGQGRRSISRPSSSAGGSPVLNGAGLDVTYVAEHHSSLSHVLLFFSVPNLPTSSAPSSQTAPVQPKSESESEAELELELEAEALPGERLTIKCGLDTSPPLVLPARVPLGKKDVIRRGGHYEVKLPTLPSSPPSSDQDPPPPTTLLPAPLLQSAHPTSFTCASCSLPLVHASKISTYKDLPSEHWAELVEAWMCHPGQKVNKVVAGNAQRGGWWCPAEGEALVGGSYVLFGEGGVVRSNLGVGEVKSGENWRGLRCLCGAIVGRCQEDRTRAEGPTTVYRLVKYAIRPVSPTAEPIRVPLSAFVVEDMMELVRAHATYRFVLSDEEEERPRLLIWLFKPSIRIAYRTPTPFVLPKNGSLLAAKVLFKILPPSTSPSELKSILNKYPGFPQAEFLLYPLDVCRRLAGLLKESNSAYPEAMRTMTGLDVGWLKRA